MYVMGLLPILLQSGTAAEVVLICDELQKVLNEPKFAICKFFLILISQWNIEIKYKHSLCWTAFRVFVQIIKVHAWLCSVSRCLLAMHVCVFYTAKYSQKR